MVKFLDTNILLEPDCLKSIRDRHEKFIISSETLRELENIKTSYNKSEDDKFKARKAVRFLDENQSLYDVIIVKQRHYDTLVGFKLLATPDNLIIACAYEHGKCEFVSRDLLCRNIAKHIFKLTLCDIEIKKQDEYLGYREITLNDKRLAEFYSSLNANTYGCLTNEYIVIKDINEEVIDKYKWNGERYVPLNYKQINNAFTGKIKPRNTEQELAFDMLQDDKSLVKVLNGNFGSGKTFLMVFTALDLIYKRKFDRVLWIRNNVTVKNSREIGFLPGSKDEKLRPYAMPFADHVGGEDGLDLLVSQGKVVVEHFATIRGRDIKNSIIICDETENMTKEHLQLLISRVGEGSALWIDGDIKQVDDVVFENNNGLTAVVDKLKANELFGYVKLQKTERSKVAELAALFD